MRKCNNKTGSITSQKTRQLNKERQETPSKRTRQHKTQQFFSLRKRKGQNFLFVNPVICKYMCASIVVFSKMLSIFSSLLLLSFCVVFLFLFIRFFVLFCSFFYCLFICVLHTNKDFNLQAGTTYQFLRHQEITSNNYFSSPYPISH